MSAVGKRLLLVTTAVVALALPATAQSFFGNGAELISADYSRLEQGDDTTTFAAISADGRYVAIQTRARNFFADDDADPPAQYRAGGVFRFNLETQSLEKVADGDLFDEATNNFLRRGASNPSISADGRFVAFATAQPLLAADVNDNVDIYVRDMTVPTADPGAFDLVSARDGGDIPASYGPPAFPFPGSNPGADLSRGVSISADGQKVAFRTDAPSDLPAAGTPNVPAGQVLLRDRAANTTTLVTRTDPGGAPAGGGLGAALSADGTTVAWTGTHAPDQTRMLGGENPDPDFIYYLWRRVADGPSAPTRRITGLADPDDPACPPGAMTSFNQVSLGPCFGPLTDQEGNRSSISSQVPLMSADGSRVAFLTGAGPRPLTFTGSGLDLYVTQMGAGLSRKQATTEVTRDTADPATAASAPIGGFALSSSGRYVAIATARTQFATTPFQLGPTPRSVAGVRELYVVDLDDRAIDRVARSFNAGDIDADVQNGLTITADGSAIGFTSFAGNLFFGDANQHADAFVATRQPDPGTGEAPPPDPSGGGSIITDEDGPRITVRAKSGRGGKVTLTVHVPAAGGVKAVATAQAGQPRKQRTLANESARATDKAVVQIVLRPVRRYRSELRDRGQIRGRVQVGYVASSGGQRLNASRRITFRERPK